MGSARYYKKRIDGEMVGITVIPVESGGPTEEEATTVVTIDAFYTN